MVPTNRANEAFSVGLKPLCALVMAYTPHLHTISYLYEAFAASGYTESLYYLPC